MIKIVGPRDCDMYRPDDPTFVNCTSHSKDWGRGLSPFINGPCKLYEGAPCEYAKNAENAWQYSKLFAGVFPGHVGPDGNPTAEFFRWAKIGYLTERANRYPVGKGKKPIYAYWAGEKLGYVESRKKIYIPVYGNAVRKTEAFQKLLDVYRKYGDITLWDFDSHNLQPGTFDYWDLWNNPNIKVGHAYVLAMLLEGVLSY